MRLKKGFTLAEILIVLMVIGVIATMTIPSMMKGVTEAQLKAGYKKAYNTISNFAAMERTAGSLPARATTDNIVGTYIALNNSLSVKGYGYQAPNAGSVLAAGIDKYPGQLTYTYQGAAGTMGASSNTTGSKAITTTQVDNGTALPPTEGDLAWIITEDNIAYSVVRGGVGENNNCETKQQIAAHDTEADAAANSCAIVYVDVNGLSKGPNTFEKQGLTGKLLTTQNANSALDTITGDRFKIYLGLDGATAGPRTNTVTGRIMADLK